MDRPQRTSLVLLVSCFLVAGSADAQDGASAAKPGLPGATNPHLLRKRAVTTERLRLPSELPATVLRRLPPTPPGGGGESNTVCSSRTAAGPAGAKDPLVDLSAAHALVREFSVDSAFATSDAALARVLEDDTSLTRRGLPEALARYAQELTDVCVLPAGPPRIGQAHLSDWGPVAVIRPGTGSIALPPHTRVLVIDLRNLPAVDELKDILPRMVAPAMGAPVSQPIRVQRVHDGPADEVYTPFGVYSTSLEYRQPEPLPSTGSSDLPIVLVVGERLAPQAAAFAAVMRTAQRAWIAGHSVPLAVAESDWQGVGPHGLSVRTSITISLQSLPSEVLSDQIASQDNPSDPSTAGYQHAFTVEPGVAAIDLAIEGASDADLDLYLIRDADGDGLFELATEVVATSTTPTAAERISLFGAGLEPGAYQLLVHGYSVPAASAEFTLTIDRKTGVPLPDVIAADLAISSSAPTEFSRLADLVIGRTPPPVSGPADRTLPQPVNPFFLPVHETAQGRGIVRAGLIATHGVVRLFYRYFPIVGDTIDARLLETLAATDSHDGVDRIAAWRILRRFGEALHDGHQFTFSVEPLYDATLPVFLEHIGGRPVVRRSNAPGIHPGDTIIALEGRPIEQVYAEELARTSAASPGYQLHLADQVIYNMNGPLTLTLEDTRGDQRSVTVGPQPLGDYYDVIDRGVSDRVSGPLSDLGEPALYYLNLNYFVTPDSSALRTALAEAQASGATGLVVDMRGYPGAGVYETAMRLIREPFLSPAFENAVYNGPDAMSLDVSQYRLLPLNGSSFAGPMILLTGPHAVSAAETLMQMLVGAHRTLAIVGQPSAATNGNLPGLSLPGGFFFTYTGMEVRNPDGSVFHGTGIVPDVPVSLTPADLRDGIDSDLRAAVALLTPASAGAPAFQSIETQTTTRQP